METVLHINLSFRGKKNWDNGTESTEAALSVELTGEMSYFRVAAANAGGLSFFGNPE